MDQLWGLDRLASLNPATGARAWYGYDGQGPPTAVGTRRQLLNDAGHVTASASYDPYGGPEGAALPSPFGYTGELTDPATGSQFTVPGTRTRVPATHAGSSAPPGTLCWGWSLHLDSTGQPHRYASNSPATGSDVDGLVPCDRWPLLLTEIGVVRGSSGRESPLVAGMSAYRAYNLVGTQHPHPLR